MATTRQVKCPTCGAPVTWEPSSRFRPFCSARCRTMDLGAWAAERHRIAGDPLASAAEPGPDENGDSPKEDP